MVTQHVILALSNSIQALAMKLNTKYYLDPRMPGSYCLLKGSKVKISLITNLVAVGTFSD